MAPARRFELFQIIKYSGCGFALSRSQQRVVVMTQLNIEISQRNFFFSHSILLYSKFFFFALCAAIYRHRRLKIMSRK